MRKEASLVLLLSTWPLCLRVSSAASAPCLTFWRPRRASPPTPPAPRRRSRPRCPRRSCAPLFAPSVAWPPRRRQCHRPPGLPRRCSGLRRQTAALPTWRHALRTKRRQKGTNRKALQVVAEQNPVAYVATLAQSLGRESYRLVSCSTYLEVAQTREGKLAQT